MQYIAHTSPFGPSEQLNHHLAQVGALAAQFAGAFDAAEWGRLPGTWHDLGKIQPAFQKYIQGRTPQGPPHAWVGAVLAVNRHRSLLPIAAAIAAHHGTLADVRGDEANGRPVASSLQFAVQSRMSEFPSLRGILPASGW
jgi:CRISPR-associated endonuclease/helicase Cas3